MWVLLAILFIIKSVSLYRFCCCICLMFYNFFVFLGYGHLLDLPLQLNRPYYSKGIRSIAVYDLRRQVQNCCKILLLFYKGSRLVLANLIGLRSSDAYTLIRVLNNNITRGFTIALLSNYYLTNYQFTHKYTNTRKSKLWATF